MTLNAIMAKRRLQEQYCLEFAKCAVGDPTHTGMSPPFSAAFSRCLAEEAKTSRED
jgi:hypothetical protein